MTAAHPAPEEDPGDTPRVRDRRRIDPQTGEVRPDAVSPSAPRPAAPGDPAAGGSDEASAQLAERTADLQRLKAEYDNYRRRVERDRAAVAEQALASVLVGLLPVLDDIARARSHGELSGGFKSVAEGLETTLTRLGLVVYGEAGEPFDPTVHEALMHEYSDAVTEPTCVQVLQPGYRLGERVLRPARVSVAEPPPAPAAATDDDTDAAAAADVPND